MNKVGTEGQNTQIPETKPQKLLRESFFLLYVALTLAYTALMAYFLGTSIIILEDLKNSASNVLARDMIDVWKTKYIITDVAVTSTNKCPTGYNIAYDFIWPGLNDLCSCPYDVDGDQSYFASYGNCSQDQLLLQNCVSSSSINSQNLNIWRNHKKFCMKYGSDTFFSMPLNCGSQSNYKKCGEGETQICVKTTDSCPISNMVVSASGLASNSQFGAIVLDQSNYLYYQYDQNFFPIAYFKISNNYFCALHTKE